MQIVIEIPKKCIPTRQDVMDIQLHFVDGKVVEASEYGFAVLSEKHGRLIDADALEEEIRHAWTIGACYRFIENAPTIIEADTESEDTEC